MLGDAAIAAFVRDGYVAVRGAVPSEIIVTCREEIEEQLRSSGVDPGDRATWKLPVVRLACPETPAFRAAGTQPGLWSIYDQLLGVGTWWRRAGVGGSIAVRFSVPGDPGDAGWHIDGSFDVGGEWWVNIASRERGLLSLFLLSDVGRHDAPTELKAGSHLDVAKVLEPHGDAGVNFGDVSRRLPPATFERPSAFATGQAGDVFICHPFLVHRATWPHVGTLPRSIAQPGVALIRPFTLDGIDPCPVERAILAGLEPD